MTVYFLNGNTWSSVPVELHSGQVHVPSVAAAAGLDASAMRFSQPLTQKPSFGEDLDTFFDGTTQDGMSLAQFQSGQMIAVSGAPANPPAGSELTSTPSHDEAHDTILKHSVALPEPATPDEAKDMIELALKDPGWLLPTSPAVYSELVTMHPQLRRFIQPVKYTTKFRSFVDTQLALALTNKLGVEIQVAGVVDRIFTDMLRWIFDVHGEDYDVRRFLKAAGSVSKSRPDFQLSVPNGGNHYVLLCEGEDEAEGANIFAAITDLALKSHLLLSNDAYSDQVKYVPAYAAAGFRVQLCLIPRIPCTHQDSDDNLTPKTITMVGEVIDLRLPLGRARMIMAAFAVFRIMQGLRTVLVSGERQTVYGNHGTTVLLSGNKVMKIVAISAQAYLGLEAHQTTLEDLYKALQDAGARNVVQPVQGKEPNPSWDGDVYHVQLQPVGAQILQLPTAIKDLQRLLTDVLIGLESLHSLGFGHTDVRLPNILKRKPSQDGYFLTDLEMAMPLNASYSAANHGPERKAWAWNDKHALEDGRFTARSDLFMLGVIVAKCIAGSSELKDCKEARSLRDSLLEKEHGSSDEVLQHLFFTHARTAGGGLSLSSPGSNSQELD